MKLAGGTVLHQKPNSNSVPAEVGVSSQPAPLPNGDGSAIRAAVAPNHRLLSRGLSRLFSHNLVGYYRHAGGQIPITHLLFADDMLIFFNVSKKSLENFLIQITLVLMKQLINKGKSALYLSKKISYARKLVIQNVSGIPEKEFPFQFDLVPIIKGRLKTIFFSEMVSKVRKKVEGWQGKL